MLLQYSVNAPVLLILFGMLTLLGEVLGFLSFLPRLQYWLFGYLGYIWAFAAAVLFWSKTALLLKKPFSLEKILGAVMMVFALLVLQGVFFENAGILGNAFRHVLMPLITPFGVFVCGIFMLGFGVMLFAHKTPKQFYGIVQCAFKDMVKAIKATQFSKVQLKEGLVKTRKTLKKVHLKTRLFFTPLKHHKFSWKILRNAESKNDSTGLKAQQQQGNDLRPLTLEELIGQNKDKPPLQESPLLKSQEEIEESQSLLEEAKELEECIDALRQDIELPMRESSPQKLLEQDVEIRIIRAKDVAYDGFDQERFQRQSMANLENLKRFEKSALYLQDEPKKEEPIRLIKKEAIKTPEKEPTETPKPKEISKEKSTLPRTIFYYGDKASPHPLPQDLEPRVLQAKTSSSTQVESQLQPKLEDKEALLYCSVSHSSIPGAIPTFDYGYVQYQAPHATVITPQSPKMLHKESTLHNPECIPQIQPPQPPEQNPNSQASQPPAPSVRCAIVRELEENVALLGELELAQTPQILESKNYKLPKLEFLQMPKKTAVEIDESEIDRKINDLLNKMRVFKIEGDIVRTYSGPIVTTFEFRPSPNVKVSRILTLQDDLAMALRAKTIRIQAPVPGKDVVGIEIPNAQVETIYLREILENALFQNSTSPLTLALGKDIVGNPFVTNLKKLPHLLIAGTTGSGKSVGINAMILSLLYKNPPDQLKLIMIDPKMVEFSIYNDIPHLLTPVITNPKTAIFALDIVVKEMEHRNALISEARVKNIDSYNQKAEVEGFEPFAHIVIIIDELADLMMTGGKEAEASISRLTQMARSSGIHLIVATQRPSVDVVTGLIKANLPSRISYKVGQKIDSKVILDCHGAESLLGNGDMLFAMGGGNVTRLHAPFSSEEEIERIVEFIKAQCPPQYDTRFLQKEERALVQSNGEADELYEEAKRIMLADGKTSISYIQRRLNIGFNKAANIVEQMQQRGFLSKENSKGVREIIGK